MIMKTEEAMQRRSAQEIRMAEQAFAEGLRCEKAGDYVSAAARYQAASQYGHPGAMNNLGVLYNYGRGVVRDPAEAFRLYVEAARCGEVVAMYNAASCCLDGTGTEKDFDAAVSWLETAAEQKDADACRKLAELYDRWPNKDAEKSLSWRKKAAEYGDAESLFVLGDHYAKGGPEQDLKQAVSFYDAAARAGTPEMRLKVAKALDLPSWEDKPALDLERAKYWYNELLVCEDGKIAFEAAKGLDEREAAYGMGPHRPALDAAKAFQAYQTLGRKGNKQAYAAAAYCYEIGRGTARNLDMAIFYYQRADAKHELLWCQRKKAGKLEDEVFRRCAENSMPPVQENRHSSSMELYGRNRDLTVGALDGRLYYLNGAYLCTSDMEGGDIRILAELDDDYRYGSLQVNATGIYLYCVRDYDRLWVRHYGLDGTLKTECRDEYDGDYEDGYRVSCFCCYDNDLYYVYEHETEQTRVCRLMCMHVDANRVESLYTKANQITDVYIGGDCVVFHAEYRNENCEHEWGSGWMLLDRADGSIECLSYPYCSLENIVDHPAYYDPDSPDYEEKWRVERNIVSFDLNQGIFWTERTEYEGKDSGHLQAVYYREPHALFGSRDVLVPGLPVWRAVKSLEHCSGLHYFDGMHFYHADSYYMFCAYDKNGTEHDWSKGNGGHGGCDKFMVFGGYLFLDIAAYDEEQYPLSTAKASPIRKTWFKDTLPKEAIAAFRSEEPEPEEATSAVFAAESEEIKADLKPADAEDLYNLGKLYAKDGPGQDLAKASACFEAALQTATPVIKLRIAEHYSFGPPIDLERAKSLYYELLECEDENIVYKAAYGLDECSSVMGLVLRPALDAETAYKTYKKLGMKGNARACSRAARCCEEGRGTPCDPELALFWYQKAGEQKIVRWYQRRKTGTPDDETFLRCAVNTMPLARENRHSSGTELYGKNTYRTVDVLDGRLYYVNGSYLCSSDMDGSNIRILAEVDRDDRAAFLHVNATGIYLYCIKPGTGLKNPGLQVSHYRLDGSILSKGCCHAPGRFDCLYFYDNKLYCVNRIRQKSWIVCLHIDEKRVEPILTATYVSSLYATDRHLIFFTDLNNDKGWIKKGWVLYDLIDHSVECLSNPYLRSKSSTAELERADPGPEDIQKQRRFDRHIVFFDLNRGIFWVQRDELEGEDRKHRREVYYWEPRSLFGDRDVLVPGLPVWKHYDNPYKRLRGLASCFFDGTHFYVKERVFYDKASRDVFYSYDRNGKAFIWAGENRTPERIPEFTVLGDSLFVNIDGDCEEQFLLSVEPVAPNRESWFHNALPEEAIAAFRGEEPEEVTVQEPEDEDDPFGNLFRDEEPEETAAPAEAPLRVLSLQEFRARANSMTGVREPLLHYRKSLPEKWDYNVFVGILMSVKGPRYGDEACMNLAIGQGDNGSHTELRMDAVGLTALYEKYRGRKRGYGVTVAEVEDEIVAAVPDFASIREFFDRTIETALKGRRIPVQPQVQEPISMAYSAVPAAKRGRKAAQLVNQDVTFEKVIGETEVKYNICTFGAKLHIGFGIPVTIMINGREYNFNTHNTVKGRFDGMTQLYRENGIAPGDMLTVRYSAADKTISIEKKQRS